MWICSKESFAYTKGSNLFSEDYLVFFFFFLVNCYYNPDYCTKYAFFMANHDMIAFLLDHLPWSEKETQLAF